MLNVDICVIGAGSGGLSVAAGASQLGASTVLIERGEMGGDCLNTGCVPSKALLAAAKAAHNIRTAKRFGVNGQEAEIDFPAVNRHVHGVIKSIEPHDSQERFEGLGVKVLRAEARFVGPQEVEAGGQRIRARRFVIATGSRAAVPPIPGLTDVPYLTNETLFENTVRPDHLVIIGGGPIGVEMAQAHRRLGSQVTVLEIGRILAKDDPDLVAILRRHLTNEGIAIREGVTISRVERTGNGLTVIIMAGGREEAVSASHILVAAGRKPNLEALGLEKAGVEYTAKGITVDARLRTSNRRIFAIGDVTGGPQFTHVAGYQAGIVIRNALFRLPAKVDYKALPWVTYTDPELAQIGLTEAQARQKHGDGIKVLTAPFQDSDRAQAERVDEGFIKIIADPKGRVLGVSILGHGAGEMLQTWGLMISEGLKLSKIIGLMTPYPTFGQINYRATREFYAPKLFAPSTRRLVRFLSWFG